MHHLLRILLLAVLIGGTLFTASAQGRMPPRRGGVQPKPRQVASATPNVKDGFLMKGGRVYLTELGITNPLTADKKTVNGTVVTPTGMVTTSGGTATQLQEGDYATLTGRISLRTDMAEADSLLKIKQFDLRFPGKREKMEKERLAKEKAKKEREEAKEKARAKAEKARRK